MNVQKVEQERLRLEREVGRLRIEMKRVKESTKNDVAAAAAAAATAAYDVAQTGSSSSQHQNVSSSSSSSVGPKFNQSSKERIAVAEGKQKEMEIHIQSLMSNNQTLEKELKCAKKESLNATSFVRKKIDELENDKKMLHVKLQERKRELDEQKEVQKEQEMKWKDVQKDITEDIKKRRELGLIITTTEQKAR